MDLWLAAQQGHERDVEDLIPRARDEARYDALKVAVYNDHVATTAALLSCTSLRRLHDDTLSIVDLAAQWGSVRVLGMVLARDSCPYLLDARRDKYLDTQTADLTPLGYAAQSGHLGAVQLLVACRARVNDLDVDDETALVRAVKNNQLSTMRFLLESGATMRTAGTDSVRVVAGRRWYADTPLVLAAERDYTDAALLLLKHGADVDAPQLTGGLTPLQTACKVGGTGRYAMAKLLLAHGADVRKIDDARRRTALCWATVTGDARLVKMLVRHKASLHHVDGDQCTPLAIAARLGRMDVALVLLKCRADVRRGCTDGRTPLQIAHEHGNYRLARLFAAATGEPYEVDPAMPDGLHQS